MVFGDYGGRGDGMEGIAVLPNIYASYHRDWMQFGYW